MLNDYFNALFALVNEMSPYLLLGFFIAGLLQAFVPRALYSRHLAGKNMGSVCKAALFGIPLPLCSCGVIPTAVSLRQEGASKGASTSFLIATPQTGVDSILATYSLLGLPFAVVRPLVALITALFGGWLVNKADLKDTLSAEDTSAIGTPRAVPATFLGRCTAALRYGFVEMMQDVGKWLVIGLLLAALITVLVPDSFFATFANSPLLNMLLILALSVPMYLCATGSIPIAMSLMLKGLSPGAALVLLMAGPATNVASLLVVSKVFGKKTAALYLLSIVLGAVGFGLIIDYLLPASWFALPAASTAMAHCHGMETSVFQLICTVAFVLMLIYAFAEKHWRGERLKAAPASAQVFRVKGMSCNHCKANVESNVAKLDGVTGVQVDLEQGLAYVQGVVEADTIIRRVEQLGYGCSLAEE